MALCNIKDSARGCIKGEKPGTGNILAFVAAKFFRSQTVAPAFFGVNQIQYSGSEELMVDCIPTRYL